jgi:hypothetical protein
MFKSLLEEWKEIAATEGIFYDLFGKKKGLTRVSSSAGDEADRMSQVASQHKTPESHALARQAHDRAVQHHTREARAARDSISRQQHTTRANYHAGRRDDHMKASDEQSSHSSISAPSSKG